MKLITFLVESHTLTVFAGPEDNTTLPFCYSDHRAMTKKTIRGEPVGLESGEGQPMNLIAALVIFSKQPVKWLDML